MEGDITEVKMYMLTSFGFSLIYGGMFHKFL